MPNVLQAPAAPCPCTAASTGRHGSILPSSHTPANRCRHRQSPQATLRQQRMAVAADAAPKAAAADIGSIAAMERRQLGRTDLSVPIICFGTMLFGESQDCAAARELLDTCMSAGVNFFDTAEMYPVPQRAQTQGQSEAYLGKWMKQHSRDQVIIASKVAGPSAQMTWIRGGPHKLDGSNVRQAVDDSLLRLQTDYIDLYQLHWPDRYVPMFGDVDYNPYCAYQAVPIEAQLEELGKAVTAGKIRYVGLSNETPWGVMKAIAAAEQPGSQLPRAVSIQNAYSLTCRTFDAGLAEVCHQEGVSLLAYSPLAMGLLTGKYLAAHGGPPQARLNKYKGRYAEAESRYGPKPNVREAVAAYAALAWNHNMSPTSLALRFVLGNPLLASAVIGASDVQQLMELLQAASEGPLHDEELLHAIDKIHQRYPNPTP